VDKVLSSEAYAQTSAENKDRVNKIVEAYKENVQKTGDILSDLETPLKSIGELLQSPELASEIRNGMVDKFLSEVRSKVDQLDNAKNNQNNLDRRFNEAKGYFRKTGFTNENFTRLSDSLRNVAKNIESYVNGAKSFYGGEGVYSVITFEDGSKIICHSSSKEIYGMFDQNGNLVPDPLERSLDLTVRESYTKTEIENIKNESGRKLNPACCAECRAMIYAKSFETLRDKRIVSLNAFKSKDTFLKPIVRCDNCKITTKEVPFANVQTDRVENIRFLDFRRVNMPIDITRFNKRRDPKEKKE
jgi:hypothetical protein